MLALLAVSTDFGARDTSVYMYTHTSVWQCLLAFACKSLCQVCLLRAKIVIVLIFVVDFRDGAYMGAFYFEK